MTEKSNLAEDIASSRDNNEGGTFDASAFLGSETTEVSATEGEEGSDENKPEEKGEEKDDTPDAEESEGDFSWNEIEEEEVETPEVEESNESVNNDEESSGDDSDWDEEKAAEPEEANKSTPEVDWDNLIKETGIKASSKEEFIDKVKEAFKPHVDDNNTINNLNTYLELSDKDLVIADMRASKYDEDNIEDTIDRLEDAGLLKREATLVRSQLTKHIHSEKDRLRKEQVDSEKLKTENADNSRRELQSFIKGKDDFFGGKVSQKDKKQLYSYITKGDFAQDIFESHANVAEAAFLWKNKEKIFKMVRSQGVEQGKSKILDGITSPNRGNRSLNNYKTKDKGFNPNKFLSD